MNVLVWDVTPRCSPRGGQGALRSPALSARRCLAAASVRCWGVTRARHCLVLQPSPSTAALALHTNERAPLFGLGHRKQSPVFLFCVYLFLLSSAFRLMKFIGFLGPRI